MGTGTGVGMGVGSGGRGTRTVTGNGLGGAAASLVSRSSFASHHRSSSIGSGAISTKRLPSKFESIRNIPSVGLSSSAPSAAAGEGGSGSQVILPPSKLIHLEISEEGTEELLELERDEDNQQREGQQRDGQGQEEGEQSEESSRVDDVIYKPAYQMDLQKTSQMAAHFQQTLMASGSSRSRPSSATPASARQKQQQRPESDGSGYPRDRYRDQRGQGHGGSHAMPSSSLNLSRSSSALSGAAGSGSVIPSTRPLSGNDVSRMKSRSSTLLSRQTASALGTGGIGIAGQLHKRPL
jgi:hypothetical protein